MIQLQIHSPYSTHTPPNSVVSQYGELYQIDTIIGNDIRATEAIDISLRGVKGHLDRFDQQTVRNGVVKALSLRFIVPLSTDIYSVLEQVDGVASTALPDMAFFDVSVGQIILSDTPETKKWLSLTFHLVQVEQAFSFPIYVHHLYSPMFWTDLLQGLVSLIEKWDTGSNKHFKMAKLQIIRQLKKKVDLCYKLF